MHKQSSVSTAKVNPGSIIDQHKKRDKKRQARVQNDLAPPAELRPEAISILQAVALSYLESGFNSKCDPYVRDDKDNEGQ